MGVLFFDRDEAVDIENTGGKGSSLARLAQAGFEVPPGFVVSTEAYSAFVQANNLQQRIDTALMGLDYADFDKV